MTVLAAIGFANILAAVAFLVAFLAIGIKSAMKAPAPKRYQFHSESDDKYKQSVDKSRLTSQEGSSVDHADALSGFRAI